MAATVVVEAGCRHVKRQGQWTTSWREAYVLGQLCLAAARAATALTQDTSLCSEVSDPSDSAAHDTGAASQELGAQRQHQTDHAGSTAFNEEAVVLAAMSAVDEALILGLPFETAQPFVSLIGPSAQRFAGGRDAPPESW